MSRLMPNIITEDGKYFYFPWRPIYATEWEMTYFSLFRPFVYFRPIPESELPWWAEQKKSVALVKEGPKAIVKFRREK